MLVDNMLVTNIALARPKRKQHVSAAQGTEYPEPGPVVVTGTQWLTYP
jgi:hypothetical protein